MSPSVACAGDSGVDARDLLNKHLTPLNGRGGGDASLAQGGGVVEANLVNDLFKDTKNYLGS